MTHVAEIPPLCFACGVRHGKGSPCPDGTVTLTLHFRD